MLDINIMRHVMKIQFSDKEMQIHRKALLPETHGVMRMKSPIPSVTDSLIQNLSRSWSRLMYL